MVLAGVRGLRALVGCARPAGAVPALRDAPSRAAVPGEREGVSMSAADILLLELHQRTAEKPLDGAERARFLFLAEQAEAEIDERIGRADLIGTRKAKRVAAAISLVRTLGRQGS
ncbi:MAG: hypothetical protein FD152_4508 [Xanthobacteraceae bacterium]|nr:MAG: hypothetical protein FD152_4508 [Xanthobacteraceae bacterium]